ncbi:hypothetical protein BDW75DRAFT_220378 [Aspergillus navahoensis]
MDTSYPITYSVFSLLKTGPLLGVRPTYPTVILVLGPGSGSFHAQPRDRPKRP